MPRTLRPGFDSAEASEYGAAYDGAIERDDARERILRRIVLGKREESTVELKTTAFTSEAVPTCSCCVDGTADARHRTGLAILAMAKGGGL